MSWRSLATCWNQRRPYLWFCSVALSLASYPLLAAGASELASEADDPDSNQLPFDGRLVRDVIADYEQQGFKVLYTTGLVKADLRFASEPPVDAPYNRLLTGLNNLGLTLRLDQKLWLVVRQRPLSDVREYQGRVVSETTGEPVAGVIVELGPYAATTNAAGRFHLKAEHDPTERVRVSREGYEATHVKLSEQVAALLQISMVPIPAMEQLVVVSSRHSIQASDRTDFHQLNLEITESMPALGEDPLRIAHQLPGMGTIGVSAKPHIRGGSHDELLVLFNNIELLEPFHLRDFQSVFSTFNPSVIQSIDVYTGGYPARFGDRMSGVMAIDPADRQPSRFGEVSLSLLNASALFHDSFSGGRGEWMLSARRGNLDLVTKQINSSLGEPSYSDWFGQLRYELDERTEIDFGVVGYVDDIALQDFDGDGEIATSGYDNLYAWAQVHRTWSPSVDGTTFLYYGSVDHTRRGQLVDEELENGTAFVDDDRRIKLWSIGQLLTLDVSDQTLIELGGRLTKQSGRYDYRANIERGAIAEIIGLEQDVEREFHLRPDGLSGGLFASLRYQPWQAVAFETGLRWDFQDYGQNGRRSQISPRLSVKIDVTPTNQLRFSAGRYYQPEGIHELQVADGLSAFQQEQYADHFIIGWHSQFGDGRWNLRTELFRKNFHDPKRRFENLFNAQVLLPELASDRVEVRPERARALGFETTLRYQLDDAKLVWLSYTHSSVEDYIEGHWESRIWDQGETVSIGASWDTGRWTIGASALWHAGWRTTRLPLQISEGEVVSVRRNGSRLKDYFSLDLRVSRTWRWENQSFTTFLEVTNVANRHNVGGIEYDVELEDGEYELDPSEETLLPLVPSIGIRWRF